MASSSALQLQSFPISHPHSATSNRLHEPPTSVGGCSTACAPHVVFMSPQRQLGGAQAPAHFTPCSCATNVSRGVLKRPRTSRRVHDPPTSVGGVRKRPRTPQLTLGAHKNLLGNDWGEWQVRALYGSSHFQFAIPNRPLPSDYMSPQRQLGGAQAPAHPPADAGGS